MDRITWDCEIPEDLLILIKALVPAAYQPTDRIRFNQLNDWLNNLSYENGVASSWVNNERWVNTEMSTVQMERIDVENLWHLIRKLPLDGFMICMKNRDYETFDRYRLALEYVDKSSINYIRE